MIGILMLWCGNCADYLESGMISNDKWPTLQVGEKVAYTIVCV